MSNKLPAILVLCTGNSCRSQMAQAYLEHFGGERFKVHSAGTEPADRIHPLVATVMAEEGIDMSDRSPTHYEEYLRQIPVAHLIVVCDGAAKACPASWPGVKQRLIWPFPDPAAFRGSPEATLAQFRRVRDEIRRKVLAWLDDGLLA